MFEFFAIILILAFLLSLAIAGKSFAPWVPTHNKDLDRIFQLADLGPGEHFVELGSGDGRVCAYVAKSGYRATGFEIAWPIYLVSLIRKIRNRNPNLNYKLKNFFKHDLSHTDVIYFFGMPDKIKSKLVSKLEHELTPGTRVISYAFPIEGWAHTRLDKPDPKAVDIYLYKI